MSLNRADATSLVAQGSTPRKRSRRMASLGKPDDFGALDRAADASLGGALEGKEADEQDGKIGTYGETMAASIAEREAWPSWEEVTTAPSNISLKPSTRTLLRNHTRPSVSTDEAREYAWWLDQFKDVVFEGGGHSNTFSTEEVSQGLLPEQGLALSNSQMVQHGAASGIASATASGIMAGQSPAAAVTASKRAPATYKQRQQIALADAELYESGVMTALGLNQSDFMNVGHLDGDSEEGPPTGVDPALVAYVNGAAGSAGTHFSSTGTGLFGGVSEAKIRAYTQWLLGPVNARARPRL